MLSGAFRRMQAGGTRPPPAPPAAYPAAAPEEVKNAVSTSQHHHPLVLSGCQLVCPCQAQAQLQADLLEQALVTAGVQPARK